MTVEKYRPLRLPVCRHNVLPIVMGASEEEYRRVAPHNSFIHVNQFPGPRELAEYLHTLDRDDNKYNQYFQVGSRLELQKMVRKDFTITDFNNLCLAYHPSLKTFVKL